MGYAAIMLWQATMPKGGVGVEIKGKKKKGAYHRGWLGRELETYWRHWWRKWALMMGLE